jgi:hypothetical protein
VNTVGGIYLLCRLNPFLPINRRAPALSYTQVHHIWIIEYSFQTVCKNNYKCTCGTPTKRKVTKCQVSNHPVSKRQVCKTSGLQNVRFTKHQVFKTPGCKKTFIYILYLWLVEIRRFCYSHACRQSDGSVLFSILEVFCHIPP